MRYQAVRWLHDLDDQPVVLYSEIGVDGYEVRKVDEYRDGRLDLADAVTETGSTMLGEVAMPSLDEIDEQPEFDGRSITKEEFEAVWRRAWVRFASPD